MITITNVVLSANVATITTSTAHGIPVLLNGGPVVIGIDGLTTAALNGVWVVAGVTSTTISFVLTHVNILSTSDSGQVILYTGQNLRPSAMAESENIADTAMFLMDDPDQAGVQKVSALTLQSHLAGSDDNLDSCIVSYMGVSIPTKGLVILGKTNDGSPAFDPIPEGPGGRSVIVEGVASGQPVIIVGNVASQATDSGAPVKMGGRYNISNYTLLDGQRGDLQVGVHGDLCVQSRNLQVPTVQLFDITGAAPLAGGVSQRGLLFPTTIALTGGVLPVKESGLAGVVPITNSGTVVGAVFSPREIWDSVLIDIAGVGATSAKTVSLEIGRIKASGAIPDVLAILTLTTGSLTLGPSTINPFTGAVHANTTWRFFDGVAFTSNYTQLGDVLVSLGGVSGNGPSQIQLNVHDAEWYYIMITSLDASFTELLIALTPKA